MTRGDPTELEQTELDPTGGNLPGPIAGRARQALLDRCLDVLRRQGLSDLSLRELAAAAGTSHRMLIYHFGSREGLLAEVVGRVEAEQRRALADLAGQTGDMVEVSRAFWRRLADPGLAPAERLFFEVYVQALHGRTWTASFRAAVITAWETPLVDLVAAQGYDREQARAFARLGLAVTRGLLLDLLISGEREVVDAAHELFIQLTVPAAKGPDGTAGPPAPRHDRPQ